MFSFPCTTANGKYSVVKGLKLDEYPQLMKSVKLIKSITPNPTF